MRRIFWLLIAGFGVIHSVYPASDAPEAGIYSISGSAKTSLNCFVRSFSVQPGDKAKEFRKHIAVGDSLMDRKQYQLAMAEFQKASELLPYEEYPRLQMQKIEAILGVRQLEEDKKKQGSTEIPVTTALQDTSRAPAVRQALKPAIAAEKKINRDSIRTAILNKYETTLKNIESQENPEEKSDVLTTIAGELKDAGDHGEALNYYEKSLSIQEEQGNKEKAADILQDMADVYVDSGAYTSSITSLEKAVKLKSETGNQEGASDVRSKIGKVYETIYNYDQALNNYEKSAETKTLINDKKGLSNVMDNIGNIYFKQQILDKSIDSYKKAAELNERLNNPEELGSTYNKMGVAFYELGNYDEAETYYQRSYDLKQKTGNTKEASMALNNLGNLNYNQNKIKKAISFYEESLSLKESSNYTYGKAVSYYNLGNAYKQISAVPQAVKYFENCLSLSERNNFGELRARSLKELALLYRKQGETEKAAAYETLVKRSDFKDVDIGAQLSESVIMGEADESQKLISFLTEEVLKQKEIAEREASERARENQINSQRLRLKNEQIKRQRIVLISMIAVIALVIVLLSLFYYQMIQKKKANKALTEKNNLISKQAKLIYDNIKSASAIQRAAMPPDSMMETELPQHFILNMPKDIVSGDFYWMEKRDGRLFVAVADCTGHGVQGAVVSMLGMALLNEIVNKSYDAHSGEILNQLSAKLKESLHASGDIAEIREGMDIVLCRFNKDLTEIEFAGANNPVYIVRNNDVLEFKGDRSPIGYYSKEVDFTNKAIKLQKGDSVYMFSDGYADQLNGENYKKFLPKRFRELLIEIDALNMEERRATLLTQFHQWRGTFQQVDDVMVMCVKV